MAHFVLRISHRCYHETSSSLHDLRSHGLLILSLLSLSTGEESPNLALVHSNMAILNLVSQVLYVQLYDPDINN
jgi:hypothetical protein